MMRFVTPMLVLLFAVAVIRGDTDDNMTTPVTTTVAPAHVKCEHGQTWNPLIGKCSPLFIVYVEDYPNGCPADVGCRPLSEKPDN